MFRHLAFFVVAVSFTLPALPQDAAATPAKPAANPLAANPTAANPTAANPAADPVSADPDAADFFETKVRPLLAKNCFACHTDPKMGGLLTHLARRRCSKAANPDPPSKPATPIKAS